MRLEIAELAEVHLEVFEQTVDELGALGEGGDGNGRALVESLEERVEQQRGGAVEGGGAGILIAAGLHVEQGFAAAVVVERLDAQMARDGEHEGDGQMRHAAGALHIEGLDHIVEEVGHGLFLAEGFVEQFGHEEPQRMARHFVQGIGRGAGLRGAVRGNLFEVVQLGFGVVIDHQIEIAEGLEEVLLGAATALAHALEDVGAHTQLTSENLGNDRRLGVGSGVQDKGLCGERRGHGYRMMRIFVTERILPLASEAKTK